MLMWVLTPSKASIFYPGKILADRDETATVVAVLGAVSIRKPIFYRLAKKADAQRRKRYGHELNCNGLNSESGLVALQ
jgi:hypothetical protein